MSTKSSSGLIVIGGALALFAGCSQVLGLGDYEIDPKLDAKTTGGGEGGAGDGTAGSQSASGKSGNPTTGGTKSDAGAPNPGSAGEPSLPGSAGAGGAEPNPGGGDAGSGPDPGSTLVPCDSVDCCASEGGHPVGVELLKDGGFELGTPSDNSPWVEDFTKDGDAYSDEAITNDLTLGFSPKSGSYYVYLSGIPGEQASVYSEDLKIPADAGWLTVSGYRYFQIDKQDATNTDFAGIGFYDPEDDQNYYVPFYWTGTSDDGWGATNAMWKSFSASWDAAPHAGKTRYLGLRGSSDHYPDSGNTKSSSYLFDQVSLKVFRCYK